MIPYRLRNATPISRASIESRPSPPSNRRFLDVDIGRLDPFEFEARDDQIADLAFQLPNCEPLIIKPFNPLHDASHRQRPVIMMLPVPGGDPPGGR